MNGNELISEQFLNKLMKKDGKKIEAVLYPKAEKKDE